MASDIQRKQDVALRLSLAGATPAEIAASRDPDTGEAPLYGSPAAVGRALKAARKRNGVEDLGAKGEVELAVNRLRRVHRALWSLALQGDVAAAREIRMNVMAQATLLGVSKGRAAEAPPTAEDPLDELKRRREERRASSQ
jgi:hypothetical protein